MVDITPITSGGGGGGPSDYGKTYTYEQSAVSDEWTIEHNMGKYPSVTVVDSAGNEIIAEVQYIDKNNLVIYMASPFKGTAYLN